MQYCPEKASKILQNELHCPAYTNTRVGNLASMESDPFADVKEDEDELEENKRILEDC